MGGLRVLVTGATGFVGRALVPDLLKRGFAVRASTRLAVASPTLAGAETVVVGEVGPGTSWTEALHGVELVIHLAGHVHRAPERAEAEAATFEAVNHLGAARLYEQATAQGVRTFVHLSSITVLGDETLPGSPFDDASPPHAAGPYACSKLSAERALIELAARGGPRLVILRPPLICGPGVGGNLAALIRLAAWPLPLPFASIENRRSLLSLDNLVSAIARVLERPEAGAYALADARSLSTGDIVSELRAGLGRAPLLFSAPDGAMSIGAALVGRPGLYRRLYGSLEVDASRFGDVFDWREATATATSLRQAAGYASSLKA